MRHLYRVARAAREVRLNCLARHEGRTYPFPSEAARNLTPHVPVVNEWGNVMCGTVTMARD